MHGFARIAGVLVVLVLLLSSAPCVMACAGVSCHSASQGDLPLCHRHKAPADQNKPACAHTPTMADARPASSAHVLAADSTAVPFVAVIEALSAPVSIDTNRLHSPSPPGCMAALSTVILRI